MARTKLPAVKRREYTVEEYNALFHAGRKGGGTGTGTGRGRGGISRAARWDARLVEVKAWVVEKGDFPRNGRRVSEEERSMYNWLLRNLPGKPSHTPDRGKKLKDAFGEGWENDFEEAHESRLEAKWDARLVQVKAWVVRHRRYPRAGAPSKEERPMYDWLYQNLPSYPGQSNTSAETSMYYWLYHNLPWTKKGSYTPDRWKKLNDAFGEGWEADFTSRRLPRLPV